MHAAARSEEPSCAALIPGDAGIEDKASTCRRQRALRELCVLRHAAPCQSHPIGFAEGSKNLWQPVVRRNHRRVRILQGLKALCARQQRPRPVRCDESRVARQRLLRRNRDAISQIGEIRVVRYLVDVEETREPWRELLVMLDAEQITRIARHAVIRQHFRVHFAGCLSERRSRVAQ